MTKILFRTSLCLWSVILLLVAGVHLLRTGLTNESTLIFWATRQNQLYRLGLDRYTGVIAPLDTHPAGALVSPSGEQYLYATYRRNELVLELGHAGTSDTRPVGTYAITTVPSFLRWLDERYLGIIDSSRGTTLYRLDTQTASLQEMATYRLAAQRAFFSPDPRWVVLGARLSTLANLETGELFPIGTAFQYQWSSDGRYIAYVENNADLTFHLVDVLTQVDEVVDLGRWRLYRQSRIVWSPDGTLIGFTLDNASEIGTFLLNRETRELEQIQNGWVEVLSIAPNNAHLILMQRQSDDAIPIKLYRRNTATASELFLGSRYAPYAPIAWSPSGANVALSYTPQGLASDRYFLMYDTATGRLIYQRVLAISDYYPVLSDDGLPIEFAWWQGSD